MMPIGDGAELARAVRALPGLGELPVVMMSATDRSVALASAGGQVSLFLKKPFTLGRGSWPSSSRSSGKGPSRDPDGAAHTGAAWHATCFFRAHEAPSRTSPDRRAGRGRRRRRRVLRMHRVRAPRSGGRHLRSATGRGRIRAAVLRRVRPSTTTRRAAHTTTKATARCSSHRTSPSTGSPRRSLARTSRSVRSLVRASWSCLPPLPPALTCASCSRDRRRRGASGPPAGAIRAGARRSTRRGSRGGRS